MTAEQFNEKYKPFIEEGFEGQGLEFDLPIITKQLDKIFEDLIRIPDFRYSQIKIKFGSARFYTKGLKGLGSLVEDKINMLLARYYPD